jgi:hypothetical protein
VQVDIDTLQKFADTLNERIDQTTLMLDHASATDQRLPLGTFVSAVLTSGRHADAKAAYTEQVRRLHEAMVKAREATEQILANYRTADEQNHANAKVIHKEMAVVQPGTEA